MKKCTETDNFARWPFVAGPVRDDGERNNGAIDLVASPEKIDLIHEATVENGLKPLLTQINRPDGQFMSLGCASGQDGGSYYSYLEITFRDSTKARHEGGNTVLEEKWKAWVSERLKEHPEFIAPVISNVAWEYREFSLRKAPAQFLVTIYPRATNAATHGQLVSLVAEFLERVENADY